MCCVNVKSSLVEAIFLFVHGIAWHGMIYPMPVDDGLSFVKKSVAFPLPRPSIPAPVFRVDLP